MSTIGGELKSQLEGAGRGELVRRLFDFMRQRGNTNYDEAVTQLEHALQCAQLARQRGLADEAVTAALFHDIGHLLVDEHDAQHGFLDRDLNHEEVGSRFLAEWFPPRVTEPIRLHVAAKRYLCSTDATYYDQLSDASKRSFELQGGRLSAAEQAELQQNESLNIALELRRLDDLGKVNGKAVPTIEEYAETVANCLR